MARNVRIKDIAEALGLSTATVSRAISTPARVAEPTRSRVRAKAAEMNYRPNVQARSLRTQKSMSIIMAVRDIGNPFYLEVFKGAETAAHEAQYTVLMGNTEGNPAREAEYFEMLRDGNADGMILMTGSIPDGWSGPNSAVVVALEMIEDGGLSQVLIDNAGAARTAVDHLVAQGHRRIAHISGPEGEGMSARRKAGFVAAMAAHGLNLPRGYLQPGDFGFDTGREATRALLALNEPPTAIFAANDEMAFGVLHEAQHQGLGIPDDLSVIGMDDIHLSRAVFPPLTTISQPRQDIGRHAMELLLSQLGGTNNPQKTLLPTTLIERATVARPRKEGSPT
ncbi:LacI family DNA-binding transcriptional regulator [Rhodobacteraceae bacterium F11138]|nr:LacI family DNA-binding transcriptional regulator [Rhodobacteraceae bacterium F11138]